MTTRLRVGPIFLPEAAPRPPWMAPEPYRPRHAAPDPLPFAVDPALRLPAALVELSRMFAAAHRVLLGGVTRA